MFRLALFCSLSVVAACGVKAPPPEPTEKPQRIVSLDYCADQYVLKFVDRERILALSSDATAPESYMRETAIGIPTVRASAEDILLLEPDLIVRAHGGGAQAAAFFERAGIPVVQVGWADDVKGVRQVALDMAAAFGEAERGVALAAEIDARLAALPSAEKSQSALYVTPSGVTSGAGGLVDDMLRVAGFENFETRPGWHALPLERLVHEQPDVIAAAFFDVQTNHRDTWSATRHPIAQAQLQDREVVMLSGAWTACGGWFILDAVEALAAARVKGGSDAG